MKGPASPLRSREKIILNSEKPPLAVVKKDKPKISNFEFYELIGIGNFGKVVKAYNKKEKRMCALKVLNKENVAAMKHVEHIINEREVL